MALADTVVSGEARLWTFPEETDTFRNAAVLWDPTASLHDDPHAESIADELAPARARGAHCIGIWTGDRPIEILAALLRHELEHARQVEVCGVELLDLRELTMHALRSCTSPRAHELYAAVPLEKDANRAASRFVRLAYGDATIDELLRGTSEFPHMLRRNDPQEPIDTLTQRMVGFLAWAGPACDRYADAVGIPFAQLLEDASTGSADRWWQLRLSGGSRFPM